MTNPYFLPNQAGPGSYGPPSQPPLPHQAPVPYYQQPVTYPPPPMAQPPMAQPYPPLAQPNAPMAPPLQQYPALSSTRVLFIQNAGLSEANIQITDAMTSAPLYTIATPKRSSLSSEPHVIIQSSMTNHTIATVRFHSMTEDIDLVIHGQKIDFKGDTWGMSESHELRSPMLGKLKWKNHDAMKGGDIRCTDKGGQTVARLEAKTWKKVQKEAKFELAPALAAGGPAMDEAVVSGIAMIEYIRKEEGGTDPEAISAASDVLGAVLGGG